MKNNLFRLCLILALTFFTWQHIIKGYDHEKNDHQFILQNDVGCQAHDDKNFMNFGDKPSSDEIDGRLLEYAYEGNIRISTYIPNDIDDGSFDDKFNLVNVKALRTVVGIAATYWEKVVSVRQYQFSYGRNEFGVSQGYSCNNIVFPKQFLDNGISGANEDLVVIVDIYAANTNVIASAGPCWLLFGKPIVGTIRYNSMRVGKYLNFETQELDRQYEFYKAALISVHQFTHILGMNSYYYLSNNPTLFYSSYESTVRINRSQIFTAFGTQNGFTKWFIKTPEIRNYVEKHFGCASGGLGALLDGESPGHWHRNAYKNQLMNPFDRYQDARLSKLTLLLLKLTGWYSNVDMSLGYQLDWGYGEGCAFMRGQNTLFRTNPCNFSNINANQCDFSSRYFGECTSTGEIATRDENFCQIRFDGMQQNRCFQNQQGASCFQASCSSDFSIISVNGFGVNTKCQSPRQSVLVGSQRITCPSNFTIFCQQSICKEHCDLEGLCIAGKCHYYDCPLKIPGCRFCSKQNHNSLVCDKCYNELQLSSIFNICVYQTSKIGNCSVSSLKQIQDFAGPVQIRQFCYKCNNGYTPSENGLLCIQDITKVTCPTTLANCESCKKDLNPSIILCQKCKKDYILKSSLNKCSPCNIEISNCQKCQIDQKGNTLNVCQTCVSSHIRFGNGAQCKSCPSLIMKCQQCSLNSFNKIICDRCDTGYIFDLSISQCVLCIEQIKNCIKCKTNQNGVTIKFCETCQSSYVSIYDGTMCKLCSDQTTSCNNCQVKQLNQIVCTQCINNYILNSTAKTCNLCSEQIKDCVTCRIDQNGRTTGVCSICQIAFLPILQGTKCKLCQEQIKNCRLCENHQAKGTICTQCLDQSRYLLSKTYKQCILCDQQIPNCKTCLYDDNFILICAQCNQKFTLKNASQCISTCQRSVQNCQACEQDQNKKIFCTSCKENYTVFDNGSQCSLCSDKIDNCRYCFVNETTNQPSCSICQINYAPSVDFSQCKLICEQIIPNCQVCTSQDPATTKCDICRDNYLPHNERSECRQRCDVLIPGCRICAKNSRDQDICFACASGFGLKDDQKECNSCEQNGLKNCRMCKNFRFPYKFWISDPVFYYNSFLCHQCQPGYEWKFSQKIYTWYKTQCVPLA